MYDIALDENFPDPVIVRTPYGYYAYGTETVTGANVNLAFSEDLRQWVHLGDAMPDKPAWLVDRQFLWAPHVTEKEGVYYLFFSGQIGEGTEWPVFGLGLATAVHPEGPFVDIGYPLLENGKGFQDIDPMLFVDPVSSKSYLYYGSGWHSIRVVEMSDDLRSIKSLPTDLLWPSERDYEQLVEASYVVYRNGWYFLFYSGDSATDPPHYAVMVARSRSPLGPFERMESPLVEQDELLSAPGHCCVEQDKKGVDHLFYHAINRRDPYVSGQDGEIKRILIRHCILFEDWPKLVRDSHDIAG